MIKPAVTALCITRRRREWIPQMLDCFLSQTYENKQLLILGDHPGDVEGLIPKDERITVETTEALFRPCRTIGAKRNLGCSLITTDLIATFDDDDYYSPFRFADQVAAVHETGKAAVGYHSAKMTDGARWWKYIGSPQIAFGASLMFTREWWIKHPFREMQIGEDNQFASEAWRFSQLATVDATSDLEPWKTDGDRMIVHCHPGNTSRKVPHDNWRPL